MRGQAPNTTVKDSCAAEPDRALRIALRLWDWSEWCRQVVRGVQRFMHDRPGWQLYIDVAQHHGPLANMEAIRPDGILTATISDCRAWRRLIDQGRTKVVTFTSSVPTALADMPRVRVDDTKIAEAIVRHLTTGGFRRLAYCGGAVRSERKLRLDIRFNALKVLAKAQGYPFDFFQPPLRRGPRLYERALASWVAQLAKPVGIVAWNIDFARKIVNAAAQAGVAVPQDVAVIAWDDDPMLAETLEPTISAAVLPAERLGYEAARLLDQIISGASPRAPVMIEPSGLLRIRQSSDVPTTPDRDVRLAAQYIHEHATEPFRIPQMLKALGISRSKLERNFLRVTGQTLNQAIVFAHLEQAKQLLVETDWPLERLAERAGFGTKRHFHHVFARFEGVTPAEYRARFAGI